jgi:pimeloyl-ACP methyl ester carboxylesterase
MQRWSLAAVVFVVAVGAAGATAAATPRPPKLVDWCVTKAERRGALALRASDGARVVGVLLGPVRARRGVVIAHESRGGLCNWLPYGRRLSREGYRVLALDLRGYGSSPTPRTNQFRYDLDIAAGVRELRRRGVQRVGLIGGSMGATAVLVAAARIAPAVDVVIAASGPTSFRGLDAIPAVRSMQAPVLFIAASDDLDFADAARALHAESASPRKQLEIVSGASHGYQLVTGPEDAANRDLFGGFLRGHLG